MARRVNWEYLFFRLHGLPPASEHSGAVLGAVWIPRVFGTVSSLWTDSGLFELIFFSQKEISSMHFI